MHPLRRWRLAAVGLAALGVGAVGSTSAHFADTATMGMAIHTAEDFPGKEHTTEIAIVQTLNPSSEGKVWVHILAPEFDPSDIAPATARFGPKNAETAPPEGKKGARLKRSGSFEGESVRLQFDLSGLTIEHGDELCLEGELENGDSFRGCTTPTYAGNDKSEGPPSGAAEPTAESTEPEGEGDQRQSPRRAGDESGGPGGTDPEPGSAGDEDEPGDESGTVAESVDTDDAETDSTTTEDGEPAESDRGKPNPSDNDRDPAAEDRRDTEADDSSDDGT